MELKPGKTVWLTIWWIDGVNEYRYRTIKRKLRNYNDALVVHYSHGIVPVTINHQGTLVSACLDDGFARPEQEQH